MYSLNFRHRTFHRTENHSLLYIVVYGVFMFIAWYIGFRNVTSPVIRIEYEKLLISFIYSFNVTLHSICRIAFLKYRI